MFGFYPSPYIVIVMLAAAGVSLPLLFWLRTRLSWINSSLRIWPVAIVATALFLLLASSGPLLKVFGQDPPPVVGEWTFETVIDPNPLETGSDAGATVTFRAIFTVDPDSSATPTDLSATITGEQKAVQADLGSNTDNGRIGIGASIDAATLNASGGASFGDTPCEPDLTAGTLTCELMLLGSSKLFARSNATPGYHDMATNFPYEVTFTATASSAGNPDFIAVVKKSGNSDPTLAIQLEVIFGPPANLIATPGNGQLALSWDDPGNTNITGYDYRISSDDGNTWTPDWTAINGIGANTISHTVTDLSNGSEYTVEVRAFDDSHKGAAASITATPKTVPDNPEDLRATVGDGEVALTWKAPVSDGGSDTTNYEYRQSADGGTNWVPD